MNGMGLLSGRQFPGKNHHVAASFVFQRFYIDLSCGYLGITLHITDCLNRYPVGESNGGGKGMPDHVKG
jgi:hypothetical protein